MCTHTRTPAHTHTYIQTVYIRGQRPAKKLYFYYHYFISFNSMFTSQLECHRSHTHARTPVAAVFTTTGHIENYENLWTRYHFSARSYRNERFVLADRGFYVPPRPAFPLILQECRLRDKQYRHSIELLGILPRRLNIAQPCMADDACNRDDCWSAVKINLNVTRFMVTAV